MAFKYAEPRVVSGKSECFFYHRTELPSFGVVGGDWDLRDCVPEYLGNYDFRGKRALDIGTASGFLTFEMEKRGAEVVSFDLDDGANWDIVPHYLVREELPNIRRAQSYTLERLKAAYWFAHQDFDSKARCYYGNIYKLPKALGEFDVVFYGMIIGHLRDVFGALYSGSRLCRETMIITSIYADTDKATAVFMPSPTNTANTAIKSWWELSVGVMRKMLGVLGFEVVDLVRSSPLCTSPGFEGPHACTSIVARRIAKKEASV